MRKAACGLAAAVLVLAAGGGAIGQDGKIDGKLIIGKWRAVEKEVRKDDTLATEFTKDGKAIVAGKISGREVSKLEGTYTLVGNKLSTTYIYFGQTKPQTTTVTVNSLTKAEMVTTGELGGKTTWVRVEDKK